MSGLILIDGHNLVLSTNRWDDVPRANRRQAMLEFLEERFPDNRKHHSVVVVFDGFRPKTFSVALRIVKVIFSGERDADSVIKDLAKNLRHPRESLVITNDRSIRMQVKVYGAHVQSCEEFLRSNQKTSLPAGPVKSPPENELEINSEFKRLWKLE